MAETAASKTAHIPSKNFSHAGIVHFLSLMEEILLTGNEDKMKLVASKHAEVHPPGRSVLSLTRRKFASLQRIKHPTGDPNVPEEIQLAKSTWCETGRKADVGTAKEKFSLGLGNHADKKSIG